MNFRTALPALALALSACGGDPATPPLSGAQIGGPFALVDQDGRPTSDRDFAGRYRLMYFGYATCPDVCPVDLQKLMAGYAAFEKEAPAAAAKLAPIFVSIDPARDTPAVLKHYVQAFHPRLVGLTGTPEQVAAAAKTFAVTYAKAGEGRDYLMDHSRIAVLFGPDGKPIAIVPHDETPQAIARELKRWVA